ncbi:MAG: ABC transporter permease [Candidatus Microsaccharimonas sossegonensis]|uniref:ABC transporter permease n=1 Tax=Candidatus Microsaccharimonas sossegonensis TaxID=2506948 RepID=A0A4Q0AIT7_9BACT|nr:MAG: ABC transporter permease [Candidatus Microsaccharimonas sossegonensis]
MKTLDIIRRAGRSLRNAKTRTILTSLAIAVGAFTIAISLAAGEGARQYANKLIGSNVNPQVLFVVKDQALFQAGVGQTGLTVYSEDNGTTPRGITIQQLTQADIDKFTARTDVQNVTPVYNPQLKYVTFEGSDKKFSGEVTSYDTTIINNATFGTLPKLGTQLGLDEVVLPTTFADTLVEQKVITQPQALIGKNVSMTISAATVQPTVDEITAAFTTGGQVAVVALTKPKTKVITLKIVALTKQSATALTGTNAFQISSEQARIIAEYTTKGTSAYQKYPGVTMLAKPGIDPAAVKADLKAQGYAPQTAKDLQSLIFTIVNTLQGIVLGFGVIALIASVFGIVNTQYISVLERTREIGLMKALGMRGRHVSRLFQFEAAWIGFLGGTIGAIIAVIVGTLLNPVITKALDLGDGTSLLIFQPIPIILMIAGLMLIAMLAGYFPALKASKLDPIEALRTE